MRVTAADLERLVPLHIRYVFSLYLALFGTAVCWVAVYEVTIGGEMPLTNCPSPTVALLYKSLMVAALLLTGPAAIYQYSLQLVIDADGIVVSRLFGLMHRRYRLENLRDIRVVEVPKFGPNLRLRFADGRVVSIERHARGTDLLFATFG